MSVLTDVRNDLIEGLSDLADGSEEKKRQIEMIQILTKEDREDRRLEFEVEKEETRKMEKSNEYIIAQYDNKLKQIETGIKIVETILNPGSRLTAVLLNNRTKVKRDIMGYNFETTGVIGSTTLNNAQKDRYDY